MPYIPSSPESLFRPTTPLSHSKFTLNAAGVAGFFGGDVAVSAMATVHIYHGRKGLGWYNSPGSYLVAQRYGQLAKSRFWRGLFPGLDHDPATLFELDGRKGPMFKGVESGSIIPETGHLAALMERECDKMGFINVEGRGKQSSVGVTIVNLHHVPGDTPMELKQPRKYTSVFAFIPISVSIGTCIACGVLRDWYSFSMILLGILASGISCLVIGYGLFMFQHPVPASGAPRGDGFLLTDSNVIILIGEEGAVNSITRGKFSVDFSSEGAYEYIGMCSLLLTLQFVAQLLLIPQGTLFGQIMFVTSLAVSWGYNSWLSSLDKEEIQRKILLDIVLKEPIVTKYMLSTRTTMAVFVLLALKPSDPAKVLDDILPNDTKVWRKWKSTILSRLRSREKMHFDLANWDDESIDEKECTLLKTLLGDAQVAYDAYCQHLAAGGGLICEESALTNLKSIV